MKMMKLLVTASAYGCIIHVVQDMKTTQVHMLHLAMCVCEKDELLQVSEERHKAAMVLQTALQNIIPINEQKLKQTASMLARQYWEKVRVGVAYCFTDCMTIIMYYS